jgi:hypothetical protein
MSPKNLLNIAATTGIPLVLHVNILGLSGRDQTGIDIGQVVARHSFFRPGGSGTPSCSDPTSITGFFKDYSEYSNEGCWFTWEALNYTNEFDKNEDTTGKFYYSFGRRHPTTGESCHSHALAGPGIPPKATCLP